ncbi:MAG TPA: aminoglycoside phosphotransferase family protein, partial [Burkholderiales bacterium]|nr:aminoglycoside phosphotransferase family protein [Burkholderiales bacterium]
NHLLLKCLWVPKARSSFLDCFDALSAAYLKGASLEKLEERTASLLPALLLARVDGKSPVEYLTEEDKRHVRAVAPGLFESKTLQQVRQAWQRSLT